MTEQAGPSRRQLRRAGMSRTVRHIVKVTPEQEKQLTAKAAEQGVTVARLLVDSAMAGGSESARIQREMAGEMFRVVTLLGRVSNNVNQIAKATNATGEVQDSTASALAAVTRVAARVEAVAVAIRDGVQA